MALNNTTTFTLATQQSSPSKVPIIRSSTFLNSPQKQVSNVNIAPNVAPQQSIVNNVFFSSKLLNYVEKVSFSGYPKTLFYTELATRLNVGDKVFIINGIYDSDTLIKKNKYKKSTDGYKVLAVDGCKIILDIDYTGQLPYTDFDLDDLIFVHNITSQSQFDYVNSLTMGLSQSSYNGIYPSFLGYVDSLNKVNLLGSNIIHINQNFTFSLDLNIFNGGIPSSNPGFYYKQFDGNWVNMNVLFDDGSITDGNLLTNSKEKNKIIVIGEDFTYKSKTFRERIVYKFDTATYNQNLNQYGDWIFDKEYKQPFISKLNFRYGKFSGTHYDGIFGSYDKVAKWDNSTWASGILINSVWNSGTMTSKSKSESSYNAKTVKNSLGQTTVVQNVDFSNNRGFGYNYIIDSTIKTGTLNQGNFENSNIGLTLSESAIDNYYLQTSTYSVTAQFINLNFCDVFSTYMVNSSVSDSIVENSNLLKSKSVNNQLIDSVVNNCQYNSDGGIQILAADLWSYDPSMRISSLFATPSTITSFDQFDFSTIRGKLKFFISDKDFLRLEKGDSFYIEKLNKEFFLSSLTIDEKILLPIETRYLLNYYSDYEIYGDGKIAKVSVTLNPKSNNIVKTYITTGLDNEISVLQEPNTQPSGQVDTGDTYWLDGYNYTGFWLSNDDGAVYSDQDVVNYQDKLFIRELGFTESNNIPIENDVTDDRSWTTLATTFSYWNPTVQNTTGQFVFASTINTLLNIDSAEGFTFSLYECLQDTTDGSTGVIADSIRSFTKTVTKKTKVEKHITNPVNLSSIDIDSEIFGWYEDTTDGYKSKYSRSDTTMAKVPINLISTSFVNNYIKASDIRSGLFVNSTWQSGYNLNYFSNRIKKYSDNRLNISYIGSGVFNILISNTPHNSKYLTRGLDIKKGDTVWLNGVSNQSTNGPISLGGRYRVLGNPSVTFDSIVIQIQSLTQSLNLTTLGLTYSVIGAEGNSYTTLSKLSIEDSTINYGFFRRTQFKNVVIQNDQFNNTDERFNLSNVNLLRLSNILFKDNNIDVNDGIIYRSHFVNGNFNTGIVYNSVWNGNTFSNGIFSNGSWESGTFVSGKFLDSNSTSPTNDQHDNRQFYKNWQNGNFQTGEFVNSVWLNGTFSNGRFYNSHFYGGIWDNGILGSKNTNMMNTSFGYYTKLPNVGVTVSTWNDGVVENAIMGGNGVVYWYDGKFNSGEFTSFGITPDNESIWYNGEFNGSKITNLARWKNGVFNSGKFWSYYGWENVGPTNSSNIKTDYGWENGSFNSGEFGNKGLTANSVWYNGTFLGGQFLGRFWKSGYFVSGNFLGSGVQSLYDSQLSSSSEYTFADSFTYSYYGLWNDGYVIENIREIRGKVGSLTNQKRASEYSTTIVTEANFNNVLWMSGTFSHDNANFNDSLWLSGNFWKGKFNRGVFNPYIDRDFSGSFSNSSFGENAFWNNGTFVTGSFWMSDWANGTFKNGFMSGARWLNGTWEYGNANNIYWENGTWKNGNWNGTPYDFTFLTQTESNIDGVTVSRIYMDDSREKDIIFKLTTYNSLTDTTLGATQAKIHLLNVFSVSSTQLVYNNEVDTMTNWLMPSSEFYLGIAKIGGSSNFPITEERNLNRSGWTISSQLEYVNSSEPFNYYGQNSRKILSSIVSYDSNLVTVGGTNSYAKPRNLLGYNTYQANRDMPPSNKIYATYSGSSNIFQADYNYSIVLTISVELSPTVEIECFVGGLSSSIFTLSSDEYKWFESITIGGVTSKPLIYNSYYPKFYTLTLSYNTNAALVVGDGAKFAIRKNSNGILRILKAQITRRKVDYHPLLNNSLYTAIELTDRSLTLPATSSISYNALSSTGYLVGLNFGNGVFKSGIWENGVWNNGYRSGVWFEDPNILKAKSVESTKTYRLYENTWVVTISCYDSIADVINEGDLISVSNIVVYDINNKRTFFREPLRVLSIDAVLNEITFEYTANFEIRTIEKDSQLHLIYVTKNIWQNGVFLNGYFEGIWNNGVFIGYPKLTEMGDSHWINGYFEGGHFISNKVIQNQNEGLPEYNSGMVQNMTFKDRNTAQAPYSLYESWMDVIYDTNSNVSLSTYAKIAGISKGNVSKVIESFLPNLKGIPTSDILNSESYFRNSKTNAIRKYVLGSKFTIYKNILGNNSIFDSPVFTQFNPYILPTWTADELKLLSRISTTSLLQKGWTWSFNSTQNADIRLVSNMDENSESKLILHLKDADAEQVQVYFNNSNFTPTPDRYYLTEVQLSKTMSNTQSLLYMNDSAFGNFSDIKQFKFTDQTFAYEYFYNKKTLDFNFYFKSLQDNASFSISKMAIYETDSIPFFQYATASKIDLSVKNPYIGIAPPIDYTNQNFNFVGNKELGIDYRTIIKQNSVFKRQNGFSKEILYTALKDELDNYNRYSGSIKTVVVIKPGGPAGQG